MLSTLETSQGYPTVNLQENSQSREEKDQLLRSNKKTKRKITNWIFDHSSQDDSHDIAMGEVPQPLLSKGSPTAGLLNNPGNQGIRSFSDLVKNHSSYQQGLLNEEVPVDEDDEISDDDEVPEELEQDERCPCILLTRAEKRRMRHPWKQALIIKMFSGNVGYMGLMRKLKRKWSLKGDLSLTDIGHKYFIARFTNPADYHFVLTQGPWMIDDNYLTIRKWVPNFIPDDSPMRFLTTWVRIPNLAVEYFDTNFLTKIGNKIGRVMRIDKTTAQAERGQFTRLSVEIDLAKPLLSKFWLRGRIWRIQYEGIRLVCYQCGKIGHQEADCPQHHHVQEAKNLLSAHQSSHAALKANKQLNSEENEDFGSWMLVKKPLRKRSPRIEKNINPTVPSGDGAPAMGGNQVILEPKVGPSTVAHNQGVNIGGGSRFELLNQDKDTFLDVDNVCAPKINNLDINSRETSPITTVNLGEDSQLIANSTPRLNNFNLGKQSQNLKVISLSSKTIQKKKKVAKKN